VWRLHETAGSAAGSKKNESAQEQLQANYDSFQQNNCNKFTTLSAAGG
jgi:hypothetical protein